MHRDAAVQAAQIRRSRELVRKRESLVERRCRRCEITPPRVHLAELKQAGDDHVLVVDLAAAREACGQDRPGVVEPIGELRPHLGDGVVVENSLSAEDGDLFLEHFPRAADGP